MSLNNSGQISLGGTTAGESIALELGRGTNNTISLGEPSVYQLAGKGSASNVDMASFRGKSHAFTTTVTSNVQNLNIWSWLVSVGWDKNIVVEVTVAAGVYVWSDATNLPALTTGGVFPNGLTIINNGYIMGKGGGGGFTASGVSSASPGGPAINLTTNCTINNTAGYIGGGGGGGGPSSSAYISSYQAGGGGAGGGDGGFAYVQNYTIGGRGGSIGNSGGNGSNYFATYAGGGGGRIMPGGQTVTSSAGSSGGTGLGGQAGGTGVAVNGGQYTVTSIGGSAGNAGSVSVSGSGAYYSVGGGGGGWGASGGTGRAGDSNGTYPMVAGAAGGKAIVQNGYTATVTGTTTMYGGVSY